MKIGIDISSVVYGTGVSDYTSDLVTALVSLNVNLNLLAFSLRRGREIKKNFPTSRVYSLPPTLMHYLWNKLHVLNVENFSGDVDVFHASDWTQPPASSPTVTTIHDLSPFLFPDEMSSGGFRDIRRVHQAKMYWASKECSHFICVSKSTSSDLQKLFKVPSDHITIIPEAMPSRFQIKPEPDLVTTLKNKYKLTDYILTIGTPQPRKNIPRLAKAFLKHINSLDLPEKLVIIGGRGWGITDIPDDPRIVFTGYLPDAEVSALMSGAAVFAFPSLYEGFGLPILVAFHHGVPVVTSNTSSLPEVAGPAAVFIDPKDVDSIAHGLAEATKNSNKLIAAGKKQLSKFSWQSTAQATLDVYKSLC